MQPDKIVPIELIDNYFPIIDGVVHTVHNYALEMSKTSDVAVVTPKTKKKNEEIYIPYKVIYTKRYPIPFPEYSLSAAKLDGKCKAEIKSMNPDIFHTHSPFWVGGFALSYGKKLGVPVVSTFHSKYYDDVLNITKSKLIANIVKNYVVNHYNRADSVWACSHGTAETLRSYGYKGDIFVMENGSAMQIPDEKRPALEAAARAKFEIPKDKRVILFVGHLIKHKNLPLILDTVRLLCNECDDYRLLIAGTGYDGEEIKKYADSLGFSDGTVRFLGRVYEKELLAGLYLCSDLFFFPSVYDNAPLVVREAAALSLPSLLTEGSNSAEAVIKDVTGFTARENAKDMAEEIKRIFDTPGLLCKVGAEAERRIPKTFEQIVKAVREKYAEVIEKYRSDKKINTP